MLAQLEAKYPGKVKVWFDFNPKLGQQIYAGCDVFLMPSRYEPCGLGQLISLRYGAVPLVRRTGGLADTVHDADLATALRTRLRLRRRDRAMSLSRRPSAPWRRSRIRPAGARCRSAACAQDWSWRRAAGTYRELYAQAIADRPTGARRGVGVSSERRVRRRRPRRHEDPRADRRRRGHVLGAGARRHAGGAGARGRHRTYRRYGPRGRRRRADRTGADRAPPASRLPGRSMRRRG